MRRAWSAEGPQSRVGDAGPLCFLGADHAISAGATYLKDLVGQLATPRVVWLMAPAASVGAALDEIVPLLARDDVLVDGGCPAVRFPDRP